MRLNEQLLHCGQLKHEKTSRAGTGSNTLHLILPLRCRPSSSGTSWPLAALLASTTGHGDSGDPGASSLAQLPLSCRAPTKSSINAVRIKPSNAQNSSSQEQGEPPTKKLKADQDGMGAPAPSQSTAPPAPAPQGNPLPASQTPKGQPFPAVEVQKASLTAMLGEHHMRV